MYKNAPFTKKGKVQECIVFWSYTTASAATMTTWQRHVTSPMDKGRWLTATTGHINGCATLCRRWRCKSLLPSAFIQVSDSPPPFLFSHKRQRPHCPEPTTDGWTNDEGDTQQMTYNDEEPRWASSHAPTTDLYNTGAALLWATWQQNNEWQLPVVIRCCIFYDARWVPHGPLFYPNHLCTQQTTDIATPCHMTPNFPNNKTEHHGSQTMVSTNERNQMTMTSRGERPHLPPAIICSMRKPGAMWLSATWQPNDERRLLVVIRHRRVSNSRHDNDEQLAMSRWAA